MPNATILDYAPKYAKAHKLSEKAAVKKLEELWDEAKQIATDKGFREGADNFYAYTMGVWKKMTSFEAEATAGRRVVPIEITITK